MRERWTLLVLVTLFGLALAQGLAGVEPSTVLLADADAVPLETGAVNMVAAVLYDYRALDTLGETVVIFAASLIIAQLARTLSSESRTPLSLLSYLGVQVVSPFMLLFGIYIILFGHVSPGGGFTGGAMLASAGIAAGITSSARENYRWMLGPTLQKRLEMVGMLSFLLLGLVGVGLAGWFLANGTAGVPLGTPGRLLSGGLIPLLSIASGVKVGAGLSLIFNHMVTGE